MTDETTAPSMSQRIFSLGLDTETVSLYLLCCGLVDAGDTLSIKNLTAVWNGSLKKLEAALDHLVSRGILRKVIIGGDGNTVYRLIADDHWRAA